MTETKRAHCEGESVTLEAKARASAIVSLAGPAAERKWAALPPLRRTACHEAAHVIVGNWLPDFTQQIQSTSIISDDTSRGRVSYVTDPAAIGPESPTISDRRAAINHLWVAFVDRRIIRKEMRAAQHQARALVEALAEEIETLAEALYDQGELTLQQIASIVEEFRTRPATSGKAGGP